MTNRPMQRNTEITDPASVAEPLQRVDRPKTWGNNQALHGGCASVLECDRPLALS